MLFTPKDESEIIQAIREAENMSTGEIRVHLDSNLVGDPLAVAQSIFTKIGMQDTKNKNGILFYIAENKKEIAVIGDENIHKYVKQTFWNQLIAEMTISFKQENYREGLVNAILKTGEKLKAYFPFEEEINKNELPDEISR